MAARRPLRAGQTLRSADLMKPQIISRDDAVTIVFKTAAITLTLRGKGITGTLAIRDAKDKEIASVPLW